jgi:hypothetical protein
MQLTEVDDSGKMAYCKGYPHDETVIHSDIEYTLASFSSSTMTLVMLNLSVCLASKVVV